MERGVPPGFRSNGGSEHGSSLSPQPERGGPVSSVSLPTTVPPAMLSEG